MSAQTDSLLSRLRQPEYTGENRCAPCTIVNVTIAIVLSTIVGVAAPPLAPVALGLFFAAIYFRGYLVPGTPELTARYFPRRLLRWFDKAPTQTAVPGVGATEGGGAVDPEPMLLEAGVLERTPDGTDLQLTDEFQSEWRERVENVREDEYDSRFSRTLGADEGVDPDEVEIRVDDRHVIALRGNDPVAMWPSEAAFIADLAAAPLLRERVPRWGEVGFGGRGQLLHGARVFLERCPACGGDLGLAEETVESCCGTAEVVTIACGECDVSVLEIEV